VFADDFQNLILLESLTRDVQRQVLRINNTLDEIEVLGNEVFTIVHNENAADVEFDIVALFLGLKKVERGTRKKLSDDYQMDKNEFRQTVSVRRGWP